MSMWIKSWNGNFIVNTDRIVDIGVQFDDTQTPTYYGDADGETSFIIRVYMECANDCENTAIIGEYKTQSRAIEVLEMIYNHLEHGFRTFSLPEE